jgi:hypothetical protein
MPELRLWCNERIECSTDSEILPEDVSDRFLASGDDAITAALSDGRRIVGIVGNIQRRTVTSAIRLRDAGAPHVMRVYDSLKRDWLEPRTVSAEELEGGVTTILEPNGFHVIELRRENR